MNTGIRRLYAFLMIPLLAAAGLFLFSRHQEGAELPEPSVRIGDRSWTTEIAATPAERTKGLSDRNALCGTCAILFLFDEPGRYGFWMSGMRFSLDLAWIRDGRIVHMERNIPPDFPGVMTPPEPATEVLETNAGDLDGISVGDPVEIEF